MAYSFGQIEITLSTKKASIKRKKKKAYARKLRKAAANPDFVPVNHAYKGYQ